MKYQSKGRLIRPGQKSPEVHFIYSSDDADQKVMEMLRTKAHPVPMQLFYANQMRKFKNKLLIANALIIAVAFGLFYILRGN